ncbi:glutaminase [Fortiea contorta]|uniref:glutaminase n=1 Tax=Fortiea contorta TaxID=1892405 RepID=UPI00034ADED7|nr:glutaminase [Fortiea contorta]
MKQLSQLTAKDLSPWIQQAQIQAAKGLVPDRIPQLAVADPRYFAVHICCTTGESIGYQDTACVFPLMSVIKPFLLLYLLEKLGAEKVLQWVGVEPSTAPFNSLEQLIADGGRPRNPMINSGAITLADKLPGKDANQRTQQFCQWLNQLASCQLTLDESMLACVRLSRSPTNLAIAHHLHSSGYLENIESAIDTYEQICCLSGQVADLALLGKLLAAENHLLKPQNCQLVNGVMFTCGLYQASAEFAIRIGLPMKSGVGGGLLAVIPRVGAIACYSPPLDSVGNPLGAIAFIEALSGSLQLSVFSP